MDFSGVLNYPKTSHNDVRTSYVRLMDKPESIPFAKLTKKIGISELIGANQQTRLQSEYFMVNLMDISNQSYESSLL